MRIEEHTVRFAGEDGDIETIVEDPGTPRGIALVCHPHPLFGGANTNKVTQTLARTFTRLGYVALRPNFRGVGGSAGTHADGRGEAERIDHDTREEKTEFFIRGWVKNGQDEVKGPYISYDALTEKYLVTNGRGESQSAVGVPQARVRAIIQPKGKNPPAEDKSPAMQLQTTPSMRAVP